MGGAGLALPAGYNPTLKRPTRYGGCKIRFLRLAVFAHALMGGSPTLGQDFFRDGLLVWARIVGMEVRPGDGPAEDAGHI